MALTTCPECGKEISDQSKECVHCGYPVKEYFEQLKLKEKKTNTKYQQKEQKISKPKVL